MSRCIRSIWPLVLFAVVIMASLMSCVTEEQSEQLAEKKTDSISIETDSTTLNLADRVIVYYLHGHRRCATCVKLEEYSREAIEQGFAEELKQGSLEWRVINYEEEGNEHYVEDYELYTKAVILSCQSGGKETEWVNLDKIWDLVGDQEKFIEYVQTETKSFLGVVGE